jgi:hypothetical protein
VEKEEVGLTLLGVGAAFGIWSATNTSPVGTVEFATSRPEVAKAGMVVGLCAIGAVAGGIGLVYRKKGTVAAVATGLTGVALFLWYRYLIQREMHETDFDMLPIRDELVPKGMIAERVQIRRNDG